MPDIRDLPVMTKADAEAIGFAVFNDVPHKVIDVSDGDFTLSAKTSDGRRVTFSFQPQALTGQPGSSIFNFTIAARQSQALMAATCRRSTRSRSPRAAGISSIRALSLEASNLRYWCC